MEKRLNGQTMTQTIAVLDAGTTRVTCFIAELNVGGEIQSLALGMK